MTHDELYRAVEAEETSPHETHYDNESEHPGKSFSIFQDGQDDNMSLYRFGNEENGAPEEQELTMTFALEPNTSVSVHKENIYPGYWREAQQKFTTSALPGAISGKVGLSTDVWSRFCHHSRPLRIRGRGLAGTWHRHLLGPCLHLVFSVLPALPETISYLLFRFPQSLPFHEGHFAIVGRRG
ncbi:hypothetical protein QBC46DRAFT_413246 [Diplogelasinospora grovesii]|uniref:Uncharacterized protein n=1 Tax=Diplogelasinospora grovesii TaxID=303347 RepID=A0AAN6MY51_9PEZI|nr:hypothetical protein QBC46DRAFT_413246 [Diplogelasinospora grovesii]